MENCYINDMKYKLPRQIYLQDISKIVAREIKEQEIDLAYTTKKKFERTCCCF